MHAKYEVSTFLFGSNVTENVKVDNRQTDKQTDKQTNKDITICPDHSIRGHKKEKNMYPVVQVFYYLSIPRFKELNVLHVVIENSYQQYINKSNQ